MSFTTIYKLTGSINVHAGGESRQYDMNFTAPLNDFIIDGDMVSYGELPISLEALVAVNVSNEINTEFNSFVAYVSNYRKLLNAKVIEGGIDADGSLIPLFYCESDLIINRFKSHIDNEARTGKSAVKACTALYAEVSAKYKNIIAML